MITRKWELAEDGCVSQTISDIQDWNFSIFTETARIHNQVIMDTFK